MLRVYHEIYPTHILETPHINLQDNPNKELKSTNLLLGQLNFLIYLLKCQDQKSKSIIGRMTRIQDSKINQVVDYFASIESAQMSVFMKRKGQGMFDFGSEFTPSQINFHTPNNPFQK